MTRPLALSWIATALLALCLGHQHQRYKYDYKKYECYYKTITGEEKLILRKYWWSTSLDWPGPTWFETGGGCDLVPQQQLGVSRGGDVGSPLLLLLLLLLLLELGLQRRRMFGFSLLPKSGAGGNAGPLLSQVSPISHIRKFCNGEKQSQKANMLPQFVFFLGTLSASTEAQACLLYMMNF